MQKKGQRGGDGDLGEKSRGGGRTRGGRVLRRKLADDHRAYKRTPASWKIGRRGKTDMMASQRTRKGEKNRSP